MANPAHRAGVEEKSGLPIFQCGICQQRYRRADHLARHARTHSHHKPYQCHICGKSFSRSDLLKRHIPSHTGPDGKLKGLPRNGAQATSRVGQACRACASNHLRCTDSKPCKRCCDKGLDCVWDSQQGRRSSSTTDGDLDMRDCSKLNSAHGQQPATTLLRDDQPMAPMSPDSGHQIHDNAPVSDGLLATESYLGTALPQTANAQGDAMTSSLTQGLEYYGGLPPPEDGTRFLDWNFLPGSWHLPEAETGDSAFDPFFPIMGLDDRDIRFLDVYNQSIPFELRMGTRAKPTGASESVPEETSPRHLAASGSEAFRHHHWRFRPDASRDHAGADEHNLSLPQVENDGSSPESRLSIDARITAAPLGVHIRDAIVVLVAKHCRAENLPRIFASFPNSELLDKLCQYYLTSPVARADTFLHVSSFDPNKKRPELLLAIVSAGAILTSDPTLTKFGYAMHEIIRHAVGEGWESNNALTRNLELLQCFLIYLEVGLWSGHSRKIEITESFLQVLLTILRRAGKFKKNDYRTPPLRDGNIDNENLHSAWQMWLLQESWKRLAYRAIRHDTNSSTCLMVSPHVSYAEITLPLPCPKALWSASSAEAWIQARLKVQWECSGDSRPQNIMEFIDNPGLFGCLGTQKSPVDLIQAGYALLSCAWGLSWECIQIRSFTRSKPRRLSSLILSSRQDEIVKLLQNFRVTLEGQGTDSNDINLRLEHLLLHLHAPLEEIQVFAGMEGPEQAEAVQPIIRDWVESEPARKAICHAGCIVRRIQNMPKGFIQGPLAFIMFHATMVLWTVSLVQSETKSASGTPRSQSTNIVWIDDDVETIALQRFVQLGAGKPCLKGPVGVSQEDANSISLDEPQKLLGSLIDILSRSHQGIPLSFLVEKMLSLLNALQAS